MTSLGSRPPPSAPEGGVQPQGPLVAMSSSDWDSTVRGNPPPADMFRIAPEPQQKLNPAPCTLSRPTVQGSSTLTFLQVQDAATTTPSTASQQGLPKDRVFSQQVLAQVPHKIQDLEHRWEHDAGVTAQESNVFKVLGGLTSAQHQDQPPVGVMNEVSGGFTSARQTAHHQ